MSADLFNRGEETMRQRAAVGELPLLELTDRVTDAFSWLLSNAGFEHPGDKPPPSWWRAKALFYIGALTMRALRAQGVLIRSGYEPEALVFSRTISEALGRTQNVRSDDSGQYARQWLEGRAGGARKALGEFPPELWASMSNAAHVDFRAVENFLAKDEPDGSMSVVLNPERRPEVANPTLVSSAGEACDVATHIAAEHQLEIPGYADLIAVILRAQEEVGLAG